MSSLNFGSSFSGPNPGLQSIYGTEYSNALGRNDSNYANILNQYQQNVGAVQGQVQGVAGGYGQLSNQVQNTIQGIGKSQSQAIQDVYAQQSGAMGQQLTNRGLGNTTVVGSMQRGLTLDSQKAQIALANQIAQLTAGYQSQLGSAGLSAQLQGAGLAAGQGNNLVGALSGYKTPYPSWPPNSSQASNHGQSVSSPYANGGRGGMPGMGGAWDQYGGQPGAQYIQQPGMNLYGAGSPGMGGNPYPMPPPSGYSSVGPGGAVMQQPNAGEPIVSQDLQGADGPISPFNDQTGNFDPNASYSDFGD